MMEDPDEMVCPFCGMKANGDYQIMLHMETEHPENGPSPFVAADDAASVAALFSSQDEDIQYVSCPHDGCGEALLLTELNDHIEMHGEERDHAASGSEDSNHVAKKQKLGPIQGESFDTKLSYALRNLGDDNDDHVASETPPPDAHAAVKHAWQKLLKMPPQATAKLAASNSVSPAKSTRKRLGKSELGPHAHEKQMPAWLVKLLKEEDGASAIINKPGKDGKMKRMRYCPNQTAGIIPVLAQFLEQDSHTSYAYLCDPAAKHVSKLKREGGFCGYRNIQVMCSFIIGANSQGHQLLDGKIPSIFDIQEYIETAWDLGYNAQGRIETGGIRNTRKYIGTPDAQAMFLSLNIACDAEGLKTKKGSKPAYELLFAAVEAYFTDQCTDYNPKVRCTTLPPIYFQHPGHSMTIVGFERLKDGSRNLLVFDPMFHDATDVVKLVGNEFKHNYPGDMLKAYRRGSKYLKKYNEFEILRLTPPKTQPEVKPQEQTV